MSTIRKRKIIGWIAIGISILITSFWAFWGMIENFHEGWYFESWLANVGLMFAQYLSPMLVFLSLTLMAIVWPRVGAGLHWLFALFAVGFFHALTNPVMFLLIIPLLGLGLLYWFGRPQPRLLAAALAITLPLLTLILSGIEPVLRVSQRIDDGHLQAQLVSGNEVQLIWAPDGPGWPRSGVDWYKALSTCRYLAEDGHELASAPQNTWRLPAVDEAVRSMARHGRNSGGLWHEETAEAAYQTKPDKEPPLWNRYSQVIYWWTATEAGEDQAYMIAYDGKVWPRSKKLNQDYLGFRCVKRP
ncbi:MAG: hypothetical protein R3293_08250 [Candidatus Promineifilaceae bacterium]|nr:hypothetical protein [Candidatus Promineifilaceae bacterium]